MTVTRTMALLHGTMVAALLAGAGTLIGCAGAAETTGEADATAVAQPVDPLACGITVTPATAVFGDEVRITRPATDPGECTTLDPGSTQTLELRSSILGFTAEQSVPVIVGADGAFETRMRIPTGIRLGDAIVTAIPPPELNCDGATSKDTGECILPRAYFAVGFASEDLEPLGITSVDVATPALPTDDVLLESYALAGPGPQELTVVVYGSSCETRPATYLRTAPADTLQLVSAVEVPPGEGCDTLAMPWTTVIEIPEGFSGYRTVTVDNVEAVLLAG
ncbi:hypothetical protein [Cryobacterium sp. AP23]